MYGRAWEYEEIELLRAHRKEGVPLRETARQLGRGYSAVKSYASDHGILTGRLVPWSPTEDACLLVLGRKGMRIAEISALMGRSVPAIRQRLVSLGVKLTELRALGPLETG